MSDQRISIHAPREGRDIVDFLTDVKHMVISIHAPREGRDGYNSRNYDQYILFQSTRPARGATHVLGATTFTVPISIHAPREGRDSYALASIVLDNIFQSTRPARGATLHTQR